MQYLFSFCSKILISVFLFTQVAFSQTITLRGTIDCGRWNDARSQNQSEYLEHYVIGFLSGLALNSLFDFWAKPYPISHEQSFLWMDKYCRENPLSTSVRGMVILFNERKDN